MLGATVATAVWKPEDLEKLLRRAEGESAEVERPEFYWWRRNDST